MLCGQPEVSLWHGADVARQTLKGRYWPEADMSRCQKTMVYRSVHCNRVDVLRPLRSHFLALREVGPVFAVVGREIVEDDR